MYRNFESRRKGSGHAVEAVCTVNGEFQFRNTLGLLVGAGSPVEIAQIDCGCNEPVPGCLCAMWGAVRCCFPTEVVFDKSLGRHARDLSDAREMMFGLVTRRESQEATKLVNEDTGMMLVLDDNLSEWVWGGDVRVCHR